jgi:nitrogen regulatory protein PII
MRLVITVIQPSQVEAVRQALADVHVTRLTICDAQGYDGESGRLVQQACVEIAVNEDFVERTVSTIVAALSLPGAGRSGQVFVMPLEESVQLYREVRGSEAV